MTPQTVRCPSCKRALRVPGQKSVSAVRCPECKTTITLNAPGSGASGKSTSKQSAAPFQLTPEVELPEEDQVKTKESGKRRSGTTKRPRARDTDVEDLPRAKEKLRKKRRRKRKDDEGDSALPIDPGLIGLGVALLIFVCLLLLSRSNQSLAGTCLLVTGIILSSVTTLCLLYYSVQELGAVMPKVEQFTGQMGVAGGLVAVIVLSLWLVAIICIYLVVFLHLYAITNLSESWKWYTAWWLSLLYIIVGAIQM